MFYLVPGSDGAAEFLQSLPWTQRLSKYARSNDGDMFGYHKAKSDLLTLPHAGEVVATDLVLTLPQHMVEGNVHDGRPVEGGDGRLVSGENFVNLGPKEVVFYVGSPPRRLQSY